MRMKFLITLFAVMIAAIMGLAAAQGSWYPGATGDLLRGYIGYQDITAESSDTDQWGNDILLNLTLNPIVTSSGTYDTYFLAQPDVPRAMIVTANTSITGTFKFTGTDIDDQAITENITISATTTGTTTKAFKTVTRVDADLTATASFAQFDVGTADLLGLDTKMDGNNVIFVKVNKAYETTRPSVTYNSTVKSLNTIDTNTAPGGYVTEVFIATKTL